MTSEVRVLSSRSKIPMIHVNMAYNLLIPAASKATCQRNAQAIRRLFGICIKAPEYPGCSVFTLQVAPNTWKWRQRIQGGTGRRRQRHRGALTGRLNERDRTIEDIGPDPAPPRPLHPIGPPRAPAPSARVPDLEGRAAARHRTLPRPGLTRRLILTPHSM
jgi:hypothetical protein